MAEIHIKYVTILIAEQKMKNLKCPNLRKHMNDILALAAMTFVNEFKAVGYDSQYFKTGTNDLLDDALKLLLKRLRPQIIPLVECILPIPDNELMSAIGNSYGDIYET